jgi:hypothetical protein
VTTNLVSLEFQVKNFFESSTNEILKENMKLFSLFFHDQVNLRTYFHLTRVLQSQSTILEQSSQNIILIYDQHKKSYFKIIMKWTQVILNFSNHSYGKENKNSRENESE